ncbi:MAG: cysteine-rich small domain-containing protein [Eubacterium sp.]|nr:cysteine-rich small domain-containing protein [Eubacterium sp.]
MAKSKKDTENYKFFQHRDCEYFPCHATKDIENFNCIFCYCPLYALGRNCGGGFKYTDKGVKNCEACLFPHKRENYDAVIEKVMLLIDQVREQGED